MPSVQYCQQLHSRPMPSVQYCQQLREFRRILYGAILLYSASASAQGTYSPYVSETPATRLYWGDTHLHTNMSLDANQRGDTSLSPADAYRVARGETITAHNGMRVKLRRPLDFLVLADHAEYLGLMVSIRSSDPRLSSSDVGRRLLALEKQIATDLTSSGWRPELVRLRAGFHRDNPSYAQAIWAQMIAAAEQFNDPGKFTTFPGFEWTSNPGLTGVSDGNTSNLHRVVIFRDAVNAGAVRPFSSLDSEDPAALWGYLSDYEATTGGEAFAIPHNSNLSFGRMFADVDFQGKPLTRQYAQMRSRWEPLLEVTQIKGDSETHPLLSATDEFADYERWNNWNGSIAPPIVDAAWKEKKKFEYARSALKIGLEQQARLGVNPFKFGLIGSTDSHTSIPSAEEDNFWGKNSKDEPSSERMFALMLPEVLPRLVNWDAASAGYAAVWAQDNTREALFAAMKRKETYATTGPRMTVRFFGGWAYVQEDAVKPDLALTGYRKGVPMGGDLTHAPSGGSPRFLILAVKDPDGANLDRMQVIKGWRDASGLTHERIYEVAASDGRQPGSDGRMPPVGSTVDIQSASYTNAIGAAELAAVWTDPAFDAKEAAFYYVRVLEIPTPRWTAHDAKFFAIKDIPARVPMVIQERAYTSPIWYSPPGL